MYNSEKIDWEKLFEFIYETGKVMDLHNYSYNFLKKLNNIIPFYAANFFLFEEDDSDNEETIIFNISNKALKEYEEYYYKIDDIRKISFNNPHPIQSSKLMNYGEWTNTEYFNDFLAKYNLYYSCGIDIHFDNRLLGTISLFREEKDPDFRLLDLMYLELIRKQSANQLNKLIEINKLKKIKIIDQNKMIAKCSNKYELTNREQEVLGLIISGKSNNEIAEDLFISINTVKKHLTHIFKKTKVKNRTELTSIIYKQKTPLNR